MKSWALPLILFVSCFTACKHRQKGDQDVQAAEIVPFDTQDRAPYRPSSTLYFDLLHTALELDFDWAKEEMNGVARLKMKPYFHPTDKVVLDAKGFAIQGVARLADSGELPLRYEYDNLRLEVRLDRTFTRQEELELLIRYTARPTMLDSLVGEEKAEEQGIYFVNPRNEDPHQVQQIWTQGESHGASAWFPTFDQPNERCTQDMKITVADSFVTLSNGILEGSQKNANGSRTDHWSMTQPHAPYLFMMAIGKFHKHTEQWRGKEVSYYVDHAFAPYAKLIFGNTPEMLEFFSNKLGVEYPWQKYAQVVVQEFVSGAMENTSATTHCDVLQHDSREHVDNTEEDYISHELFHQWFGDLVTCESWANLTLNEGFATYGEYLWKEYKYGRDEADHHLQNDLDSYLGEAERSPKNLIRYHHDTPDDMFDAHSYQKGGLVLHMLRYYLGDPAFFQGLKLYLTRNAYSAVEVAELRMAFEEVCGEDLQWFFDQWYLRAGHPMLEVTHTVFDEAWKVQVRQVQDLEAYPCFRFPVRFELQTAAGSDVREHWVESPDTSFVFTSTSPLTNVVFDPDKVLLAEVTELAKPAEAWAQQFKLGESYVQRSLAMAGMEASSPEGIDFDILKSATQDPFWAIRQAAFEVMGFPEGPQQHDMVDLVIEGMKDPNRNVRMAVAGNLLVNADDYSGIMDSLQLERLYANYLRLANDSSYSVQRTGLWGFYNFNPQAGLAFVEAHVGGVNAKSAPVFGAILACSGKMEGINLAKRFLGADTPPTERRVMLEVLGKGLKQPAIMREAFETLKTVGANDEVWWIRYAAINTLSKFGNDNEGFRAYLLERKEQEKFAFLLEYINNLLKE